MPTCCWIAFSSICICWRSFRSRAPSGSSRSSTRGRLTRARASATRCRWPPESSAGRRAAQAGQAHELERLGARVARARARGTFLTRQAIGHVLRHGHVGEERVVLEHGVDVALVGRHARDVDAVELEGARASGWSKPAIRRRQVVLPEPEGPSSEKNSPSRMSRLTPSTRPHVAEVPADVDEADRSRQPGATGHRSRRCSSVTHSWYGTHSRPPPQSATGVRQKAILSKFAAPLVSQPLSPSSALPWQAAGTAGTEPNQAARSPCGLGRDRVLHPLVGAVRMGAFAWSMVVSAQPVAPSDGMTLAASAPSCPCSRLTWYGQELRGHDALVHEVVDLRRWRRASSGPRACAARAGGPAPRRTACGPARRGP